ncbi:MAG: hypothetical protein VX835_02055 [Pseudomonadota bacterium]|nr:hypothetical protein [Pseudomonadota bacterium]
MAKEQGVTYNFEAVNTLGAKPKLAYWMAKSTWKQNSLFIFSFLMLTLPISTLIYATVVGITLMQQISFAFSIVGIIQFAIVQDFFETINYIAHAENCRQKQVIGCQKIQSLNETITSNTESLKQKRAETTSLIEKNSSLKSELECLKTIVHDNSEKDSQSERMVSELHDALIKILQHTDNEKLAQIKNALIYTSNTLRDHGKGKIVITTQHYTALKGLLLKVSESPEKFSRYAELSEKTIRQLEKKVTFLNEQITKINKASYSALNVGKRTVKVDPEFQKSDLLNDICNLSLHAIKTLQQHPESLEDKKERLDLSKNKLNTNTPMPRQASMFETIGEFLSPVKNSPGSNKY